MASIAVVIPCYNLGAFVVEAIESAVGQTRSPAEVVVVDDGSTDVRTRDRLAHLDVPGVTVVRTPNRGVSAARNHGVRLTSAAYLVTLDADDRLRPTYLERTAAVLDEAPEVAFVSTAIHTFGDAEYEWTPPAPSLANALTRGAPHPATMFRRELWLDVGGFSEATGVQGCEDLDFWLMAIERGFRGVVLADALLEYRLRSESVHHSLVSQRRQAVVMEAVLRRHAMAIGEIGTGLLVEKERFIEEQRGHHARLSSRRGELHGAIEDVDRQINGTLDQLARTGRWGTVDGAQLFASMHPGTPAHPLYEAYLRAFLQENFPASAADVLCVGDSRLTRWAMRWIAAGGAQSVDAEELPYSDLHRREGNSASCLVALDLLQRLPSPRAALGDLLRVLRPGGTLLCALPAVYQADPSGDGQDLWRFTEAAARRLFSEAFPLSGFHVSGYGNILVCAAVLAGVEAHTLTAQNRDTVDPMFPVLYGVRAVKPRQEPVDD